ncbi:PBP1A family penicillin-binding protein [Desulfosarcina sp. OttesenSCG-928-G10]|nr:PBP1A family penicillin-binding protein [Desulfosarcina sp. OttesenSCG-928-G10]
MRAALALFWKITTTLFYGGLALAGVSMLVLFCFLLVALKDLPRVPEPISRINDTPTTEIFSADGRRILTIGGRETVALDDVAPTFVQAILATEDHRFFEHHGINKGRTVKALCITLFQQGQVQGGSTITQQLAKNLFFSFERTLIRKFRELLVAFQIESQFSKQDILETYLNQIPFGVGAYGIGEASRIFFGKTPGQLTLAESALLAGLPKSPTRYNPFRYPERALERRRVVLKRMVATGMVAADVAALAADEPLMLSDKGRASRVDSYFLDAVMKSLEERYGPEVVYHGGLRVFTTLDVGLQQVAETAMQEGLSQLDTQLGTEAGRIEQLDLSLSDAEDTGLQGALVSVDVATGAIRAMVGGRDFFKTPYNRALQNNRQPGSGFKPFLYYAVMERLGKTPADIVEDKPVSIPLAGQAPWRPRNFEGSYGGPLILKKAFVESVNTVAAGLVQDLGPDAVVETAHRSGIRSELSRVYSVALGTSGVSPLEMASAYATFAAGGVRHEPFWIRRVEDINGRILEEHIITGERVLNATITYQLVDMMVGAMNEGTGKVIRRLGFSLPAAGKTGTTNGYKDAWFTGFTPSLSTSVWVGFDRGREIRDKNKRGMTGARAAAPIWAQFMKQATQGEPPREFMVPADIYFQTVDPETGGWPEFGENSAMTVAMRKR